MAPRSMNLQYVCDAHRRKKTLDPMDRVHVLKQMEAEGHKRVEAFLFEQILLRNMISCCTNENVSTGWTFERNAQNVPMYWFKLNWPDRPWNICDDAVARFLLDAGCSVILVEYEYANREFYGRQFINGNWESQQPLESILARLTAGKNIGPKEFRGIDVIAQRKAINAINEYFSDEELYHLSLSRILTNCYIAPWFQRQPMDVDVCCVVENQLRLIEFKRKYPTAAGTFGIDNDPHGILVDWLESLGVPLLHIILVDPLWNKDESPMHLLTAGSVTASNALWIGTKLTSASFTKSYFSTSGTDSGMFGGNRNQREIFTEKFHLLGSGLVVPPEHLRPFLIDPDATSTITSNTLKQERDTARRRYSRRQSSK